MTLQERLAMTQGQDNGMDIILGGIPAAAQQEQVQQLPATALRQTEADGRLTALDAEEALGLSDEQQPHRAKRISISISEELLPEGAKQLTKDPAFQDALTAWIKEYVERRR